MHKLTDKLFHHHETHDEQGNAVLTKKTTLEREDRSRPHNPVADVLTEEDQRADTSIPLYKDVQLAQMDTQVLNQYVEPTTIESHIKPLVVDEVVRVEEVVEIQPVIHRHIETREIRHIERHIYETVPSVGPRTVTMQPVIEETIQPVIIEEVTTIIHREVPEVTVVRQEEHITERVVQPTVYTKEVVNDSGKVISSSVSSASEVYPTANTITTTTTTKPVVSAPADISVRKIEPSSKSTLSKEKRVSWKEAHHHEKDAHHDVVLSSSRHPAEVRVVEEERGAPQPHFIENAKKNEVVYETSSLDIRAQLSLERLADLQAMHSGFPALAATQTPHYMTVSNVEMLEKASEIGLTEDEKRTSITSKHDSTLDSRVRHEDQVPSVAGANADAGNLSTVPTSTKTPSE